MEKEIINKLINSLNEIRNIFDISVFLIIKRGDEALWDIVMGGTNLDSQDNLNQIANVFKKKLLPNDLRNFSRIVLLNSTDSFVKNIRQLFVTENSDIEIIDTQINDIFIKRAYLLYSK